MGDPGESISAERFRGSSRPLAKSKIYVAAIMRRGSLKRASRGVRRAIARGGEERREGGREREVSSVHGKNTRGNKEEQQKEEEEEE